MTKAPAKRARIRIRTTAQSRQRVRRLLCGASVAGIVLGSQGAHAQTQTAVTAASNMTSVSGAGTGNLTVSTTNFDTTKSVAFNRFSEFTVADKNSVTLILPTNTQNLVNVVNSKVVIDGAVVSKMQADSKIGGNLYFMTSGGLVVGATGSINTGRLIVRGGDASGALPNTDNYFGHAGDFNVANYGRTALVDIGGKINAPGGIDIQADKVLLGAGASLKTGEAAMADITVYASRAMVSTAGLVEGAALVKVNGGIAIVGADAVTFAAGSTLDARKASDVAMTGGIDITSAGAIKLNGTLTAWDGVSGTAADIKVAASKAVMIGTGFSGLTDTLLANYYKSSTADTSIDVTGSIVGGVVSLTSDASASTAPNAQAVSTTAEFLANRLIGKVLEKVGLGLDVVVTRADARSAVTIGSGANVTAAGDLTVSATSKAEADGKAKARLEGKNAASFALAVGVAQLGSTANVSVAGALKSGGAVTVAASNDATSSLDVLAKSTKDAKAGAVAYTEAKVDATVTVAGKIDGTTVSVTAKNAQADEDAGFENVAKVNAYDGSPGGGAAAVMKLDITSNVNVTGAIGGVTVPGDVTIEATTETNRVVNQGESVVGDRDNGDAGEQVAKLKSAKPTDIGNLLDGPLGSFADAYKKVVSGDDEGKSGSDSANGSATRFGAAVGVLFDSQKATVNATGTIVSTGLVNVASKVVDSSVRNNIKAETSAEKDVDGNATTIAGAAAWSKADYTSTAIVGGTVTANGLAVNASTERLRGEDVDTDLPTAPSGDTEEVLGWAQDLLGKADPILKVEEGFFSNSAGATAKTDSAKNAAISGSVSYADITANTKAQIAPLAKLTLGGPLSVDAKSAITMMNLSGVVPIGDGSLFATEGGKGAAGIVVTYSGVDATTLATIGKGVTLDRKSGTASVDVNVNATGDVSLMTLAPQAGQSNGITGSGTFAANNVTGKTLATISKDARLDLGTGKLTLGALSRLELWAVGGSIAYTKADGSAGGKTAGSIGVSGALNYVDFDTRARVTSDGDAAVDTAATPGITAGNVAITAATTGSINALSVAGAITDTSKAKPGEKADESKQGSQTASKPVGTSQAAKDKLRAASGAIANPIASATGDLNTETDKATADIPGADAAKSGDAASKGTVTKGFGVSGSASVNLSSLTTRVETTGANFIRAAAAPAGSSLLLARATEGVDLMAVTGAASIVKGSGDTKGNILLSGAYGLSATDNVTSAIVAGTTATGFGEVDVQAASNGTRVSAGLALSVDTTKDKDGKLVAGSVSHLIANDGAIASVTDSTLTGTGATAGKVDILAYNGVQLAAGAGGLTAGKGKGAGGAATVIQVGSPAGGAAGAKLVNTVVSDFGDLSVRGLTAARIIGAAAAGAISTDKSGAALSAALSINLISLDSEALIDTGATGHGKITVGGAVNVFAGDIAQGQSVSVAAQGRTPGTAAASLFSDFAVGSSDFSGDDPIRAEDLKGGTQILSIAVPLSAAKGNAAGIGFAWNSIDNDRTAGIIGGGIAGTPTITAGSLSVKAVDNSDILALGVGVGASTGGVGLMGSISRNLIEGTSSATLGKSSSAGSNLSLTITNPVGATPNVVVGANADGGIWSLAGAVGVGKNAAAGLSVSVNDIVRTSGAGLTAAMNGVTLDGTPDVAVDAATASRITAYGIAVAASTNSAAIAGAATANRIAPTVSSSANGLNYLTASAGDLKVRANDRSSIKSTALVLGISAKTAGVAAGVSVNRIDTDVSASLGTVAGDKVLVRNLLIDTASVASTTSFGLGAGGGKSVGVAGSIAVNLTDSDVLSKLNYTGGEITTTGSIGVVARRDLTIDVGAGAIGIAAQGAGIGASVIVNTLGGSADAQIVGSGAGTITAFTGADVAGSAITSLRTGEINGSLPQFDGLDGFKGLALNAMIDPKVADYKGVAVNAASTAATRTIAIAGAVAGSGAAIGVTGVVNTTKGTTNAEIRNANVTVGGATANDALGIDVRASSQQVGVTFAGSLAGSGSVAVSAPIVSDGYAGTTNASITGGTLTSAGAIIAKAIANQSSTALAAAGAVGGSAAGAVAAVSPRFESTTTAAITTPTALVARGNGGVAVNADSMSRTLATFVTAAGAGTGAGAGAIVVATNENKTSAIYTGARDATTQLATGTVTAKKVAIDATSGFSATVAGASAAAAANAAIVGNGVGVVHRGSTTATADALKYDNALGTVSVKAAENVAIATVVGQVAIAFTPASAGASLGAIAVLAQSKVDATISRPSILNASAVTIDAKGYNQINALQLGVAVGGVGIGANVTYIGIGKVSSEDQAALTGTAGDGNADQKVASSTGSTGSGNSNLTQMQAGGSKSAGGIAAQTGNATTAADRTTAAGTTTGRDAFGSVKSPGDDASAIVRAQLVGGSDGATGVFKLNATNLTIDSDANLLSKSTNAQVSAGAVAGSATVGITRNAAQSLAAIGNVTATGGTLNVNATTGEAAGTLKISLPGVDAPTMAAEANIYAGTVGIGALSVGVADVQLKSVASARSDGMIGFDKATIKADDATSAKTFAVGAVAGGAAVNVVISKAVKNGTVAASVSRSSVSDDLSVLAVALGGARAESYAGSGGLIFAGNAAVALATDSRKVSAIIAENAFVSALKGITVSATSTPLVYARSLGVAISGGIAAGASVATATSDGVVEALVGEGGRIVGDLSVLAGSTTPADGSDNVTANASGSAGGYLAAANGAIAKAQTTLTTRAVLGANIPLADQSAPVGTALFQAGKLTLGASRALTQYAEATGITVAGVLAVGIQRAESNSSGDTRAAVENVDGSQRVAMLISGDTVTPVYDDARITSLAYDYNRAKVTAGAGGLGAGIAADAITNTSGSATTEILTPTGKTFLAGAFQATANYEANYKANSDSTLATLAGGSGTTSTNTVASSATVNLGRAGLANTAGANSFIHATDITIKAAAKLTQADGGQAKGAGGGVVTGQASAVVSNVTQTAEVNLRNGVTLRQFGGDIRLNERGTLIDAAVDQAHNHAVTLDVGGVMQLPHAQLDGNYTANANVNVGDNVLLRGDKGIGVGTLIQQRYIDTAAVQIYGLAGLGGGTVNNKIAASGNITVGNGTIIETFGDIALTAGKEGRGVSSDVYTLTSQTDVFNNTLLPLSVEQGANSVINANNTLTIGGATLRAARDLILGSEAGTVANSAEGTGHNPYLALLSISTKSGSATSKVAGNMVLNNSTLIAGFLNNRTVTIDAMDDPNTQSTIDGRTSTSLGDSKGLKITTNNSLYDGGNPDSDWLGKYTISAGMFDSAANIAKQITDLEAQARNLGLTIPTDPNSTTDAKMQSALRKTFNEAGAKSSIIASLGTLYETRQALTDSGITKATKAVVIGGSLDGSSVGGGGGLFAAGGRVTFAADAISGTKSTINAYGGAKVIVQNNANVDTVIGNIYVPFKVNGAIDFVGKADKIVGLTLDKLPPVFDSLVQVSTIDKANVKSDIIVAGTVQNIGGAFKASTPKGNYIQFGAVNVASFSASSPNGLFTVSLGGGTFSQGLPLAFYNNMSSTLSLFSGRTNSNDMIAYVASYILDKSPYRAVAGTTSGSDDSTLLTRYFLTRDHLLGSGLALDSGTQALVNAGKLKTAGGYGYVRESQEADSGVTVFGGCLTGSCLFAQPTSKENSDGVFVYDGGGDAVYRDDYFVGYKLGYRKTTTVTDTNSGTYGAKTSKEDLGDATITATQVTIDAKYVDISGTIKAGPIKERQLTIGGTDAIDDLSRPLGNGTYARVSLGKALGGANIVGGNGIDLLQGFSASYVDENGQTRTGSFGAIGGGQNLGGQFIRTGVVNGIATGYVKVDDVVAAGGGKITISGKILNTNPVGGGMLQVLNGFGNIGVDNRTSYDLQIGTINAGLSADGRITLADRNTGTTVYTNTVGGQVTREFFAPNGGYNTETYRDNQGLQNGGVLSYNPTGRVYYVWQDGQSLERSVTGEGTGVGANSGLRSPTDSEQAGNDGLDRLQVSAWAKVGSNQQGAQLGKFVDIDAPETYDTTDAGFVLTGLKGGNANTDAARIRLALSSSTNTDFVQVTDGKVTRELNYFFTDSDDNDDGFFLQLPTAAEINVLSAAKATHPIRIMFDQGTGTGGINIKSNSGGKVNLTGTLTFGGGTTAIETNSAIVAEKNGLVISKNVSLKAQDSIGTFGNIATGTKDAAFRANLLGGFISADSAGTINLALKSVATTANGESAPILVSGVRANGDVKITADSSIAGLANAQRDANIRTERGTVMLDVAGSITGNVTLDGQGNVAATNYFGANNIASAALKIDMPDASLLTIKAQGDVAIEQGSGFGTSTTRELRIGSIETTGDVLIKAWGSIVAGDPTATVDQAKLDRFLAAAKALGLAPGSTGGVVDPATIGGVDQAIRADAYAAYDRLIAAGDDTAAYNAAVAVLIKTFGSVPASRQQIATSPIMLSRDEQIAYQLRNQGRDAYTVYALTNPGATAEDSRGIAVAQTLTALDKIAALNSASRGVAVSGDGKFVSVTDATSASLVPGGDLYQIAVAALAAKGTPPATGTATTAELQTGLQLYLDGLRAPVATLLPAVLPDLTLAGNTARGAIVSDRISNDALAAWVAANGFGAGATIDANRKLAVAGTLSALDKIAALTTGGVTLSADGKTIAALTTTAATLTPGGSLYQIALNTLAAKNVTLAGTTPTSSEIQQGLQLYLDGVRQPVASFLPAVLTDTTKANASADVVGTIKTLTAAGTTARTSAVGTAIASDALKAWVTDQNLVTQRANASADALGKIEQIQAFGKRPGLQVSADGRTVTVTTAGFATKELKPGGELYELGLSTLRSVVDPVSGLRNKIPLPTNDDVQAGLQIYLTTLRAPLDSLLPTALPLLDGTDVTAKLAVISRAISADALKGWAAAKQTAAVTDLKTIFGLVPVSRDSIATAALSTTNLAARTSGANWTKTMLDVQIPSTAFVPVADAQVEYRAPVITARGVTLVAGNSIGAFGPQRTFSYVNTEAKKGYAGATDAAGNSVAVSEALAAAYLATSGPGDLKTVIDWVDAARPELGIKSVAFTTRRDQPLQLAATGTVNAVAAVNIGTIASNGSSALVDRSSIAGNGATVLGDIFVNNTNAMTIGSVVSAKTRTAETDASKLCNLGGVSTSLCDSRVRLVGASIAGVTTGASRVAVGSSLLSDPNGRSVVMGGLVRIEASNGSIAAIDGSAIKVDTRALEVLRAAGDITLERRSSVGIPLAGGGSYGFWNTSGPQVSDLAVGDVFAGGTLTIDNPYGSLLVVGLASNLASENRNSRIVTNILSLRAAGDIGSTAVTSAGKVGQFDIQSPIIKRLVSGFDYTTGTIGRYGQAPAGFGTGSTYFALRGASQIGGAAGTELRANSLLGARGDIVVGTLNNREDTIKEIKSDVTFLTDILVGGLLSLKTDGGVHFPDETVRISGLDTDYDPNTRDLRKLALDIGGPFTFDAKKKNLILGSLTAGGGLITSEGYIRVDGTIFGNGGPETPFEIRGTKGVTVGSAGLGSIALIATEGDVEVTGQMRATDFIAKGVNVKIASGIYGRSASITAAPNGTVSIGGSISMVRSSSRPDVAATFALTGGALTLSGTVAATDAVTVRGTSITGAPRTMFLNTKALTLAATGALTLDKSTLLLNIGDAKLSSGTAANGGSTVSLSTFSGGALDIQAPVGISVGATTTTGAITLGTTGLLALGGNISAGGLVNASAGTITFATSAGIRDANGVVLTATQAINGNPQTTIQSRGLVTISTRDTLTLGAVKATGGSITVTGGNAAFGGLFASNGTDYRIKASGAVNFAQGLTALGNFGVNAGTDLTFAGSSTVAMNGASGAANLDIDTGGALIVGRDTKIVAKASNATARINAGSVAMDGQSGITGMAVALTARGVATLGDIRASEAYAQAVTLRASGGLSVGAITGGTTTIAASAGAATMRDTIKATGLTITARDDIVTNGVTATSGLMISSLGSVMLNGTTRIVRPEAPSSARLTINASKTIGMSGATSASGGIAFSAPTIVTNGAGYITDLDMGGALTSLRADTIDVAFDTGSTSGPALRIDVRGRSASNVADGNFRFNTLRPITFDSLYIDRGSFAGIASLTVNNLNMRDYLVLGTTKGTVALKGAGTPPAGGRIIETGSLTNTNVGVTSSKDGPVVSVGGATR